MKKQLTKITALVMAFVLSFVTLIFFVICKVKK